MNSNQEYEIVHGDIFKSDCDTIVIPRNTSGQIYSDFEKQLQDRRIGIPKMQASSIGEYETFNYANVGGHGRVFLYLTTSHVKVRYNDLRYLGYVLAQYAAANANNVKSIAFPIIGINSANLEAAFVCAIIDSAFKEKLHHNCKLVFYTTNKIEVEILKAEKGLGSSRYWTFIASIRKNSLEFIARDIKSSESYYYSKALDVFRQYLEFKAPDHLFYEGVYSRQLNYRQIETLLASYETVNQEFEFLNILAELIAYVDYDVSNIHKRNTYDIIRVVLRTTYPEKKWIESLINYKIEPSDKTVDEYVFNLISYLGNPANCVPIAYTKHINEMYVFLNIVFYDRNYTNVPNQFSLFRLLHNFFKHIDVTVANDENRGCYYAHIMYLQEVRELWDPEMNSYPFEDSDIYIADDVIKSNNKNKKFDVGRSLTEEAQLIIGNNTVSAHLHSDKHAVEDLLGYGAYAYVISSFIKAGKTDTPFTIGIYAPWGRGKTTMMQLIKRKLDGSKKNEIENTQLEQKKTEDIKWWEFRKRAKAVLTEYKGAINRINTYVGFLKLLKKDLTGKAKPEKISYPTIWFNAWRFQKPEQVWAGFAYEIINQLVDKLPSEYEKQRFWLNLNIARTNKQKLITDIRVKVFNNIIRSLWNVGTLLIIVFASLVVWLCIGIEILSFSQILPILSIYLTPISIKGIFNWFKIYTNKLDYDIGKYLDQPDYKNDRGYLHKVEDDLKAVIELLVDKDKPMVVFIDDLDRCSPKIVAEVIESINMFVSTDFKNCYFIMGQDAQMVASALDVAYKDISNTCLEDNKAMRSLGWNFMEKFVQLQFSLPNISTKQVEDYLSAMVNEIQTNVKDSNSPDNNDEIVKLRERIANSASMGVEKIIEVNENINKIVPKNTEEVKQIAELKEQVVDKAVESYSDNDPEIIEIQKKYVSYLTTSPRTIKQFANLYRFYRFLQSSGQMQGLSKVKGEDIARWVVVMLRWPQLVRVIQWNTDDNNLIDKSPLERAEKVEAILKSDSDIAERKIALRYSNMPDWLKDNELITFIKNTYTENCSLEAAVKAGIF